jgi:hypothetical protein
MSRVVKMTEGPKPSALTVPPPADHRCDTPNRLHSETSFAALSAASRSKHLGQDAYKVGLPRVIEELFPAACHVTEQYANNAVEADHGRLKARLRPMRDLKRLCSARVISAGHAFVQNLRRGHYELGLDIDQRPQLTVIFTELARAI